jgi:hypothetical protein
MNSREVGSPGNVGAPADSPSTACETPRNEYSRRLDERAQELARIRVLHHRLRTFLIVFAGAGSVIAYESLALHLLPPFWILLPTAMLLYIVQLLTKNARTHSQLQRIVSFYELGVARLHHRWQGRGTSGTEFLPKNHAYAADLDLFGTGSLFELLCTARTGIGRAMLAGWLLHTAECSGVTERQLAASIP